jgi:hypothetical protein
MLLASQQSRLMALLAPASLAPAASMHAGQEPRLGGTVVRRLLCIPALNAYLPEYFVTEAINS